MRNVTRSWASIWHCYQRAHMRVRPLWSYEECNAELGTHMTLLLEGPYEDKSSGPMRNVTQSWAPIWYHHRFYEFILIYEIIMRSFILCTHTYFFNCILRVLVWSDYCIPRVGLDNLIAWWYLMQATVLISISCMWKTQCFHFSADIDFSWYTCFDY